MRHRGLSFRGRLIAALVLSSATTLLVAGLTLLPPLQQRLRGDAEHSLLVHAKALAPRFAGVPSEHAVANAPELEELAERLHRQAGARVQVYARGALLVDTEAARRPPATAPAPAADGIRVERPIRIGAVPARLVLVRESSVLEGVVGTVRRSLLEAALAGLLVALVLGFLVARRLLRRVDALRRATHEIAEGGTVNLPRAEGHDELGDLTRAFARMQERLARQEQARRTFVSTASHELRTPLTSLAVMLELAAEDLAPGREWPERAREQVDRARGQAERLTALAEDLLDLSRMDAGVELAAEPAGVGELARSVAGELSARAATAGLDLVVEGEETAVADPGATARIVRILLDNALRFAPPGTTVSVLVTRAAETVRVQVVDAGPGVPAEEGELIFERFARGRTPGGSAGFGLGLAIARELAERMGGSLALETQAPEGARLTLSLPAAAVESTPGPLASDDRQRTVL